MTDEASDDTGDEDRQRLRLYETARSVILDRQRSNSEGYDKAILTLASGALGLSLSFIKDLLPASRPPAWSCLLYLSWWLLTAAILTTVCSFLLSNAALNKALEQAWGYYLKRNEAAFARTRLAHAVDYSNYLAGALFVFGIVLTVIFVSVNFHEAMSMKKPTERIILKEGQTVPHMQKTDVRKGQAVPQMQQTNKPAPQTPGGGSTAPAAPTAPVNAPVPTPPKK
jgi:hypothetical protein